MKKFTPYFVLGLTCLTGALFAADKTATVKADPAKTDTTNEAVEAVDIAKTSKAFGHLIAQNVKSLGLQFDMPMVIQGLQECLQGLDSPMTEAECIHAISLIQETSFKAQCADNLQKAEDFLAKNKKEKGVIELEPGKLQYVQLQPGTGEVVQPHYSPVIRYVGTHLDGKVFGESRDTEVISLDETIQGFSKAIVGMKQGEKRKVFIHPDFGYGTAGFLPPNSLLTFEIEIVEANAPKTQEHSVTANQAFDNHSSEIATIDNLESGTQ